MYKPSVFKSRTSKGQHQKKALDVSCFKERLGFGYGNFCLLFRCINVNVSPCR